MGYCPRCYAYQRRHNGVLPDRSVGPMGDHETLHSQVPAKLAEAVREAAGSRGVSAYIRQLLEGAVDADDRS